MAIAAESEGSGVELVAGFGPAMDGGFSRGSRR